jgi:hypothetical protein
MSSAPGDTNPILQISAPVKNVSYNLGISTLRLYTIYSTTSDDTTKQTLKLITINDGCIPAKR